jgi:diguanylate cyclase (GGDEF)-like protein
MSSPQRPDIHPIVSISNSRPKAPDFAPESTSGDTQPLGSRIGVQVSALELLSEPEGPRSLELVSPSEANHWDVESGWDSRSKREEQDDEWAEEPITNTSLVAPALYPETRSAGRGTGVLIRMDGPRYGEPLLVPAEEVVLGRGAPADLRLDALDVSRRHARLTWTPEGLVVEDLSSQNGTFVNGRAVRSQRLRDGDLLRLGTAARLRFAFMDEEQELMAQRLYRLCVFDPTTEVFSRQHFRDRLERELSYARRHRRDLGLLLIDIDRFSRVNEIHGHATADTVLRHLAGLVSGVIRGEDLLARYEADRFVLLLRETSLDRAAQAAERVRHAVEATRIAVGAAQVKVTVSIGCATLGCLQNYDPQALIDLAHDRLERAKAIGPNRVIATVAPRAESPPSQSRAHPH